MITIKNDANLWRLAATTQIVTPVPCCNAGKIFSTVATVLPACNTANPHPSGWTVYFNTQSFNPQYVPLFVNNTYTGYHPVNADYAT